MKRIAVYLSLVLIFLLCSCSAQVGGQYVVSDSDSEGTVENTVVDENGELLYFASLLEQYPDIVGWITVPGTVIDYPVVQGSDNEYYLTHDYKGDENRNGAIYLDCRVTFGQDGISRNAVIHGHNMRSGVMFENLTRYDDPEFFKRNYAVRFDTLYEKSEWVIFAVMKIDAYGGENNMPTFDFLITDFENDEAFFDYVSDIRAHSVYDTTDIVTVTEKDRIITMSTCSYEYENFRTVLVARQIHEGESFDFSALDFAKECIMPPAWGEWQGTLERGDAM